MPVNKIVLVTRDIILKFESSLFNFIFGRGLPPGLCSLPVVNAENSLNTKHDESSNILNFLQSPFLYAVPKHRRSLEKRKDRKFGWPQWVWKPLVPKTNILMCDSCGHDYQAGHLCGYCYNQVKIETEAMQKAIQNELQLNPVDKEVVVLYEGEAEGKSEEFWKGKRIIEMKKPRPAWFSSNLMQKSSNTPTDDKNFKPSDLA